MFRGITSFGLGIAVLSLIVFSLLRWLNIPSGNFIDWLVGIAAFEWLLIITTVPWNIHFEAREVLAEADRSRTVGIAVIESDLSYTRKIASGFLAVALGLHLVSTGVLYALAVFGISSVGYIGSALALLLTVLRPTIRGADYIFVRLRSVRQAVLYPREDVQALRARIESLEEHFTLQQKQLATHAEQLAETGETLAAQAALQREERAENHQAHERLAREARSAISQLTTDGQFLDHVREILRFFKTA